MVAAAVPRYFVHPAYEEALPDTLRVELVGFLSMLMRASYVAAGLFDEEALVVDMPRSELARRAGKSPATVARYERQLEEAGVVEIRARVGAVRVLRILALDAECADRATDARPRRALPAAQVRHPRRGGSSPMTNFGESPLFLEEGSERSRLERERAQGREQRIGQAQLEDCRQVARALVLAAGHDLAAAAPAGADPKAWTLGRRQVSDLEAAVQRRLESLRSAGGAQVALELTDRDLSRVVGFAARAERPAAYLHRAIQGGDWRSDPMAGSAAAAVQAQGPRAEMPQERQERRSGPPRVPARPATPEERARLERAVEALGCDRRLREAAAGARTSAEVARLTQALERAFLEQVARQEVLRG